MVHYTDTVFLLIRQATIPRRRLGVSHNEYPVYPAAMSKNRRDTEAELPPIRVTSITCRLGILVEARRRAGKPFLPMDGVLTINPRYHYIDI